MMTLNRFRALAESYGAEPGRWPEAEREAAAALLGCSAAARAALEEARRLDAALSFPRGAEGFEGGEAAALARLRAGVGARIAVAPGRSRHGIPAGRQGGFAGLWRPVGGPVMGAVLGPLMGFMPGLAAGVPGSGQAARPLGGWPVLCACGGLALAAGLALGVIAGGAAGSDMPAPADLLAAFQAAPLHVFVE